MTRLMRWHGWIAVWLALIVGLGPANTANGQTRPDRLILSVSVNGEQVATGEAAALVGQSVRVALIGWLDVRPPAGHDCGGRSVVIAHAPVGEDGYPAQTDAYSIGESWRKYGAATLTWTPATAGTWDVEVRTLVLCDWPARLRLTTDHPVHDDGKEFPEGTAFVVVAPLKVQVRP